VEEVSPPGSHDAYLLDTSAYSAFKRGNKQVVAACRHAEKLVLPCVVLGELYAGFRLGGRESLNRRELSLFMRSPRVSTVDIDEPTAERYAAIRSFLREAGTPVSANDMWIAASAMRHGLAVLTCDGDFLRIPQIIVVHVNAES
jgi:tRNA(fMet)-specific endonuclease VapC